MLKRDPKKEKENNHNHNYSEPILPQQDKTFARPSQIGPQLKLKGEISGREDITLQGEFEGSVILENNNITIERSAKVKAEIRAKNITIRGKIDGNVHASGKVDIEKEGQMTGDISASRISIQEGAQFKGSVKILKSV